MAGYYSSVNDYIMIWLSKRFQLIFTHYIIGRTYMVKSAKQTFPPVSGDHITTIQILNSTRQRLKAASRKDQTYDDKINELLDLEVDRKT